MRRTAATLAINAVLIAAAVLVLLPLWWMLVASVSVPAAAGGGLPGLVPRGFTLEHYRALFTRLDVARNVWNSTLIATAVTGASLLFNSAAGYAFAKLRFAGRERVFRALLAALVIPAQVAMLPLFLLLKEMGLVNSVWGVVVPGMTSIFGIFLVRQYALSIPDSLLDAARVDGAGELRVYWSVVLPLCRPILVTLAIFTFMGAWNDFMWPLVVLTDRDLHTLPVALANLMGEHAEDTELTMAGAVLTVLPVMVLFACLQRHYIEGLMRGSLKG